MTTDPGLADEILNRLAGRRPREIDGAAVLLRDLEGLMHLNQRLQSASAASSTPTKAEFDALQRDVAQIHERLVAVIKALRLRLIDA